MRLPLRTFARRCVPVVTAVILVGCEGRGAMNDQPKAKPMSESVFFSDGTSARPLVDGTVPRGGPLPQFAAFADAATPRPELSAALLERGRERFNIFCSVCHGRDGYGRGMVVQRGFSEAASYHTERLRGIDDTHIFKVVSEGTNNMPAYGSLILPADRWAIVAYVRALQLSQHARIEDVPDRKREGLGHGTVNGE